MSAAKSPVPPPDAPGYTPPTLPQETVKALRVLKAHLPELLAKHPRRVAACDTERVLFIGDDQKTLYAKCLKRGLKEREFVVAWIVPDAADFIE